MRNIVVLLLSCYGAFGLAHSQKPNVLFIVVDDLRPAIGCYGYNKVLTPNIDQLAARSIRFTQAHTQQAVCAPSRTSFLTGRRPDSTRVFAFHPYYWRDAVGNFTTLPQHFKENGYHTHSIGKIFHHGRPSNNTDDYPYSWSQLPYRPSTMDYKMKKVCPGPGGNKYMNLLCAVDVSTQPEETLPDIQNAEHAVEFLKTRATMQDSEPFFLGLGLYKPHVPFKFPKRYLDLYPLSDIDPAPNPHLPPGLPPVAWNPFTAMRVRDDIARYNISFPWGPVPDDLALKIRQHYYASTTYMDYYLGQVLSALDKYGFSNNTIITFMGDHGWSLGEHQEWSKFSLFEISTRVPMMIYVPQLTHSPTALPLFTHIDPFISRRNSVWKNGSTLKFHAGLVSDAMVELVDIFPTLADLAGLKVPPICPENPYMVDLCTEGSSLVPLLEEKVNGVGGISQFRWKNATFSQYPRPSDMPQEDSDKPYLKHIKIMGYSITTSCCRYTEWVGYNPKTFTINWHDVHARELYLHETDSLEDENLADNPNYKELVEKFSFSLKLGWRAALPNVVAVNLANMNDHAFILSLFCVMICKVLDI
ncbi:iduronate 2-sulfatase-like [Lineus longissimus]|uniref:iduronate 2-sulfatase-like n=1 Tax=Lineus longissimus TaxID=88925 RepID=UPI002B4F4BAC